VAYHEFIPGAAPTKEEDKGNDSKPAQTAPVEQGEVVAESKHKEHKHEEKQGNAGPHSQ